MTPKRKARTEILKMCALSVFEQMDRNEEVIEKLIDYLETCKDLDDIAELNMKNLPNGLWFGDCRIIGLIGAYTHEILFNIDKIKR